jgi:hypothetical protein
MLIPSLALAPDIREKPFALRLSKGDQFAQEGKKLHLNLLLRLYGKKRLLNSGG